MDEKKLDERKIVELSIDDILPNRFQPRIKFDDSAIFELSESIKIHGVFQPIIVRPLGDKYEIIAGERRYKASVLAGRTSIPAIIMNINDSDSIEIALIENVQRSDLTPIEEAISYKKILDMGYISQEALAQKLGKTQSTIANKLRLLNLDDDVQEALLENKISERHARSLLKLKDFNDQKIMLEKIINERLTVRKTDEEISKMINNNDNTNPFSNLMNVPTDENQGVNPFNSAVNVAPVENIPNDYSQMSNFSTALPVEPSKPVYNIGDVNNQVFNPSSFDTGVINSSVISSNAANVEFNPDSISVMDVNNIEQNARDFNSNRDVAPMQDLLTRDPNFTSVPSEPESVSVEPEAPTPVSGRFFTFPSESVAEEPVSKPVESSFSMSNNSFFTPTTSDNNNPFVNSSFDSSSTSTNSGSLFDTSFEPASNNTNPFATSFGSSDAPSMFSSNVENNTSFESNDNDFKFAPVNVVNNIPEPGFNESQDNEAINIIKEAIAKAQQLGFNISVSESDGFDKYQFVIDVNK